jgi:dTDP-4-amino-4,6-dideoxygalactose transaminase
MRMLFVAEPILGPEEKRALSDVIDDGWITMGSRVHAFEQAFAKHHRASDAVAVNSCTAALHLIMQAAGIGPGDEVLVPSLTFVATANSVIYAGARPIFVDIESTDVPLISIDDAAAKCTPRTKAVVVMHYAGYPVERAAWRDFAESRDLLLIEDAAHAAGLRQAGTIGHAAAFSFYGNKNMTTAEGGIIIAEDDRILAKARQMRAHGMTSDTHQRLTNRASNYDVTMLGYNYRMDELRAAIGLVQLGHLDQWNSKRERLVGLYRKRIKHKCSRLRVPFPDERDSSHHLMPVLVPAGIERQAVVQTLRDAGVQTTIHYPPVHDLSFYRDLFPSNHLLKTEEFAERELTLPLHPRMEDDDVETVVNALATALAS